MVPMPGSAGNHQVLNARAMAGEGRAGLVLQGPDLEAALRRRPRRLMGDPGLPGGPGPAGSQPGGGHLPGRPDMPQ